MILCRFRFQARVTTRDTNGNTALHNAALGGHAGAARVLLKTGGASPNVPNAAGQTALHCAVDVNCTEVLAVLMKDGRAPALDLRDDTSMTPLLLAVAGGQETQARILLHKGADPLLTADSKVSCLHVAVKNSDLPIVTMLTKANRKTMGLRDPCVSSMFPPRVSVSVSVAVAFLVHCFVWLSSRGILSESVLCLWHAHHKSVPLA